MLAGPDDPTDEATLQAWAARNFARGFDPAALIRHQTVSLVGHLEGAAYQLEQGGAIGVPTTVIQGTADPLVSVAAAADVASRIPGAELQLIPGMGHTVSITLAPELAEAIVATARQAESQSVIAPSGTQPPQRLLGAAERARRALVAALAGKKDSIASSARVISIGVPKTVVVLRKARVPCSVLSRKGTAMPA